MPQDRNGAELEVGDRVLVEAEVVTLTADANQNCTIRTVQPQPGHEEGTYVLLHSAQLEKAKPSQP